MNRNEQYAYDMGYDCGLNGPNKENCHYSIFSKPEYKQAWERGNRDGKAARPGKTPPGNGK